MRITSSGNIGIGTDTPTARLTIDGTHTNFGSELITNGGFTGNAAGWTLGDCATYGSNEVTVLYTSCSSPNLSTTFNTSSGKTYRITFDIVSNNNDQPFIYFNNNTKLFLNGPYSTGSHTVFFSTDYTGTETMYFESYNWYGDAGFTIDNISIKEAIDFAPSLRVL